MPFEYEYALATIEVPETKRFIHRPRKQAPIVEFKNTNHPINVTIEFAKQRSILAAQDADVTTRRALTPGPRDDPAIG